MMFAVNDFRVVHLVKMMDVMQMFLMAAKERHPLNIPICYFSMRNIVYIVVETLVCSQNLALWMQVLKVLLGNHQIKTLAGSLTKSGKY
jgi:hypothetical protein